MDADVIVSGSGPGGATAASVLAGAGVRVLLIDKASFPRPKVCGDGIPPSALGLLDEIGVAQQLLAKNPNEITRVRIVSPTNRSLTLNIKLKDKFYIIPRTIFDSTLHEHAITKGARFLRAKVKAPLMDGNKVAGVEVIENGAVKTYTAKMVIAADGGASPIASQLRTDVHQKHHRIISMRGYLKGLSMPKEMNEGYMLPELVPGYLWLFPVDEHTINIGLGMRMDRYHQQPHSLREILDGFFKRPEIKSRLSANWELSDLTGAAMNLASQYPVQRVYDGAILVGDAGAWIAPLTGGGIYNAIFTGKTAAEVALKALDENDTSKQKLRQYDTLCHDHMWREIKLTYSVQRLIARYPFLIDVSLKLVNKKLLNALRLYQDVEF